MNNLQKIELESFILKEIIPVVEEKNEMISLDWSNDQFYAKLYIKVNEDTLYFIHLIYVKFDESIIRDYLVFYFAEFAKNNNINTFIIPEWSEQINHVCAQIGFEVNSDFNELVSPSLRLVEYSDWKNDKIEEPDWHKSL